jgi:cytochrome P450
MAHSPDAEVTHRPDAATAPSPDPRIAPSLGSAAADRRDPEVRLPPAVTLPRWLQTAGFIFGGERYLDVCRRRLGDAVFMRTLFDDGFVMVFSPELLKQLFQGPHHQLNAGEANALLGPIVGERSVLLLDGEEHLRHRRLLLPPFHGRRMAAYESVVVRASDAEIDAWPVGEPFPLLPSMQSLTLHVILQAVFGYEPGPAEAELARRLRAFVDPLSSPRSPGMILRLIGNRLTGRRPLEQLDGRRRAVDQLLFAEIERRRALPEEQLAQHDDVFSALLVERDEAGERLSDREVRDELLTLLLAGHETTATALAWAFDLLLHDPRALARARELDDLYLDAVAKEALRARPVIPGVGRVVRGAPFRLGQWVIPEGVEINPSIRVLHARGDLYPDPRAFRPERFLTEPIPDTYTWLPFGGGPRRCLGASFAMMEMRLVLRRVLERCALRPAHAELEKAQLRAITLAPRRGAEVVLAEAPVGVVRGEPVPV